MKQIFFVFLLLGGFTVGMNAQSCQGTAKMDKKACAAACAKAGAMAAANAAAADETIESRTDADSGKVTYVRKDVCPVSGKVSYADVEYCTVSKAFKTVAAAPAAPATKKSCTPVGGACCKKGKGDKVKTSAKTTKV